MFQLVNYFRNKLPLDGAGFAKKKKTTLVSLDMGHLVYHMVD